MTLRVFPKLLGRMMIENLDSASCFRISQAKHPRFLQNFHLYSWTWLIGYVAAVPFKNFLLTTCRKITSVVSIQMAKLFKLSTWCQQHQAYYQGTEWNPHSEAFPSRHSFQRGWLHVLFCLILDFRSLESCSIFLHASSFFG